MLQSIIAAILFFFASLFGGHQAQFPATAQSQPAAAVVSVQSADPFGPLASRTDATSSPIATTDQTTLSQNVKSAQSNTPAPPNSSSVLSDTAPAFNASNFVTQDELNQQLLQLSNSLTAKFSAPATSSIPQYVAAGGNIANPYAAENAINQLSNVTITNPTIENPTITGLPAADIPLQSQIGQSFTVDAGQSVAAGSVVSLAADGDVQEGFGPAIGALTAVATTTGSSFNEEIKLDSTHFVMEYTDGANGNKDTAVACSVSGTTITCGSPVLISGGSTNGGTPIKLDSTHFVFSYQDSNNSSGSTAVACSVSGTTITCGSPVLISTSTNTGIPAALDTTHFAFSYSDSNNSSEDTAVACSVSGTTITCGSPVVFSNDNRGPTNIVSLDSTHFVTSFDDSTNSFSGTAVACSVSGTTVTCGSPVAFSPVHEADNTQLVVLDSSHFVPGYVNDDTNAFTAVACSLSGTTITCGAPVIPSTDASHNALNGESLDSTHLIFDYENQAGFNAYTSVACSTSGTTITCGSPVVVSLGSPNAIVSTTLDSTHFATAYLLSSDGTVQSGLVVEGSVSGTIISLSASQAFFYDSPSDTFGMVDLDSNHFVSFDGVDASADVAGNALGITILGLASAAASAGQSVNVIYQGIVSGLSGLTAGTAYYANGDGTLTTTITGNRAGVALSSSQILLSQDTGLLDAGSANFTNQFFGDAVFQNGFRITEAKSGPQALDFLNQFGKQVAALDQNGNLTVSGAFSSPIPFPQTNATTTASSTIAANFADASAALQNALAALGDTAVRLLGDAVYAANGIFDDVFAKTINSDQDNTQKLCIGATCIDEAQLDTVLAQDGIATTSSADASSTPSTATSTSSPPALIEPTATSSDGEASDTSTTATTSIIESPIIQINGDNPAIIQVGDSYNDLGATITDPQADLNLGIETYLNGTLTSNLVIDTSAAATDTIDYVATDQSGLTSTSTRTVIIEPNPFIGSTDDASTTAATSTSSQSEQGSSDTDQSATTTAAAISTTQ